MYASSKKVGGLLWSRQVFNFFAVKKEKIRDTGWD